MPAVFRIFPKTVGDGITRLDWGPGGLDGGLGIIDGTEEVAGTPLAEDLTAWGFKVQLAWKVTRDKLALHGQGIWLNAFERTGLEVTPIDRAPESPYAPLSFEGTLAPLAHVTWDLVGVITRFFEATPMTAVRVLAMYCRNATPVAAGSPELKFRSAISGGWKTPFAGVSGAVLVPARGRCDMVYPEEMIIAGGADKLRLDNLSATETATYEVGIFAKD